ncbi:hypothetical protein BDR06DRAFT_866001, partial [Suillus hirtellus]
THPLKRPFQITTVDGSPSSAGQVTHYCMLYIRLNKRLMYGKFNITKLSKHDNILFGKPWLSAMMPTIDWK